MMKTLAVRLDEEQHAQLGVIAQLAEMTVTDAIRQAVDQWIASRRSTPELQARAEAVLADIDRDADARREAIASLLAEKPSGPAKRAGALKPVKGSLGRTQTLVPGYL
jgi:hypothetical protein